MYKILISLLFSAACLAGKNPQMIIGKIIKYKGESTILHEHKHVPAPVAIDTIIRSHSSIHTKNNSYATIELNNFLSYLKLGQNSKLDLYLDSNQKTYFVHLYSGHVKALFKKSDKVKKMIIFTNNAKVELENNKTLTIFGDFINQTTVFNYKGNSVLKNLAQKNSPPKEVVLGPNTFSSVDPDLSIKDPEFLTVTRRHALLKIFEIKETKNDGIGI